MSGPRFDPSFNLGHIITVVGVVAAFIGSWYINDYRLTQIEVQLRNLSTVVVENARIDERVADLRRRVDNLERRP